MSQRQLGRWGEDRPEVAGQEEKGEAGFLGRQEKEDAGQPGGEELLELAGQKYLTTKYCCFICSKFMLLITLVDTIFWQTK